MLNKLDLLMLEVQAHMEVDQIVEGFMRDMQHPPEKSYENMPPEEKKQWQLTQSNQATVGNG